jgi:hypothetical protein
MQNRGHNAEVERSNNKSTIREERQSSRGGSEGRKEARKEAGKEEEDGHCTPLVKKNYSPHTFLSLPIYPLNHSPFAVYGGDPRFLPGEVQDCTLPVISPGTQRYVSHAPPVISPSRKEEMGKRD